MSNKTIYLHNYVYRITDKNTGMHYYGTRSCDIDPKLDIGFKYFGSLTGEEGKAFKADQKAHPAKFKYKVISLFSTRGLAVNREIILHKIFDVKNNPKFHNKSNQTSTGWDTTGVKLSPGHITKIVSKRLKTRSEPSYIDPRIGRPISAEHKANSAAGNIKTRTAEGYVHPLTGGSHTAEHKANSVAGNIKTRTAEGYVFPLKDKPQSLDHKKKSLAAQTKVFSDPEFVHPMKGTIQSPEHIKKVREALAKIRADPSYKHPLKGRPKSKESYARGMATRERNKAAKLA